VPELSNQIAERASETVAKARSLPSRWGGGRSVWTEGPRRTLESKLESVLVEPERRADEDDARAIVFAKAAEEQQQAD
jgi:hypothetical protein